LILANGTVATARIRRAETADAPNLTRLALTSKGTSGYDAAFMQACRAELTVRAESIPLSAFAATSASMGFRPAVACCPSVGRIVACPRRPWRRCDHHNVTLAQHRIRTRLPVWLTLGKPAAKRHC
jgi:hypothetical protein